MPVFKQAMKRILQDKIRILVLLVLPLLMVGMFSTLKSSVIRIGIADNDNSVVSRELISYLKSQSGVTVLMLKADQFTNAAVCHTVDYSIVIDNGFESNIISGSNVKINEFYVEQREKLFYEQTAINSFVTDMKALANGSGHDSARFRKALDKYNSGGLSVTGSSGGDSKSDWTDKNEIARTSYGFIAQFMLYMSVITAGLLLEDKNSGVFYRVFYAPVTLRKYLAGNILCYTIIAVVQALIMVTAGWLFFGLNTGAHPVAIYLLFVAFAIACVGLGILIVSVLKKPVHAYFAIILVATLLVMFGGCYFPSSHMPGIINKIGMFEPASWLMKGVDDVLYKSSDLRAVAPDIGLIMLFAAVFFAGGLFRKVDIAKQ